jgi:hypothetical protein
MVDDSGHRDDLGGAHRGRTPGETLVADIEALAAKYKPAIVTAVGPLTSMAEVVAFYGSCCDLMTVGWVELAESVQAVPGEAEVQKAKLRVEILRGLCIAELQRLFNVIGSSDPRKAAGL